MKIPRNVSTRTVSRSPRLCCVKSTTTAASSATPPPTPITVAFWRCSSVGCDIVPPAPLLLLDPLYADDRSEEVDAFGALTREHQGHCWSWVFFNPHRVPSLTCRP